MIPLWQVCGAVLWAGCQHEQRRHACQLRLGHAPPCEWETGSPPDPPCWPTWRTEARCEAR